MDANRIIFLIHKIKTLVVYVNNCPNVIKVVGDTVRCGLFRLPDNYTYHPPALIGRLPVIGEKIRGILSSGYEALSYVYDWLYAVCQAPELDTEICNAANLVHYRRQKKILADYELIIIMHSVAGDDMSLLLKTAHWFDTRKGKLAIFIGNEYDCLKDKIKFIHQTEADYVCTQLPLKTACWLYGERGGKTHVIAMPHALNPVIFRPIPNAVRHVDIGFIGARYPVWIGECERNDFIEAVRMALNRFELKGDIRIGAGNIPREEWRDFLSGCHGIPGSEAGTYYLDRHGDLIDKAKSYVQKNPMATFNDIQNIFSQSQHTEYRSGKCISSRHFEAIGTKTCQILLEGDFNGILEPGQHYLCVKKDLSNLGEVLREFQDETRRRQITEQTYSYVLETNTYRHRIREFLKSIT